MNKKGYSSKKFHSSNITSEKQLIIFIYNLKVKVNTDARLSKSSDVIRAYGMS